MDALRACWVAQCVCEGKDVLRGRNALAAFLVCGMAFRQKSCVSVAQAIQNKTVGCLRPCMVASMCTYATFGVAFGPIGVCFALQWHRLRPVLRTAFGLKMRFIVKFSHKSLSEWFSCCTFAPQASREAERWREAARGRRRPKAAIQPKTASVCTRVRTSCKCTLSAKQSCKCRIAHSVHIKNTA